VQHYPFLPLVYAVDRAYDLQVYSVFQSSTVERLHVLGETRATKPAPGIQEVVADTHVGTYPITDVIDVRAHPLSEGGKLVHEGNAGSQHRIRCVLCQFRRTRAHHQKALTVTLERRVEVAQHANSALVFRSDDHAVRPHEVGDSAALLEELRVGCDGELQ